MDFLGINYLKICDFLIIFPFDIKKNCFLKGEYLKTKAIKYVKRVLLKGYIIMIRVRAHVCKKPKTRLLFVALSI